MARQAAVDKTLGKLLEEAACLWPRGLALVHSSAGIRYTWGDMERHSKAVAKGLVALDVQYGDRVAIWAPNCARWALVLLACARIGAILVTANTSLRQRELAYLIKQSGSCLVCIPGGAEGNRYLSLLKDAVPYLAADGTVRSQDFPSLTRVAPLESGEGELASMLTLDGIIALGSDVSDSQLAEREAQVTPQTVANMQYTSGTTGFPKGAMLTHKNIYNNGYWTGRVLGLTSRDRICLPVPYFHCIGCVMGIIGSMVHGSAMVIQDRFMPGTVLRTIQEERCSVLYAVPSMFQALLNHRGLSKYDLSSLRAGMMAGENCPPQLVRESAETLHMPGLSVCYGLTEASPLISGTWTTDDPSYREKTVGRPLPGLEISIRSRLTGLEMPAGQSGEIWCRGWNVMLGYYNMPEQTKEVLTEDGWLRTGDIGLLDENGCLCLRGRLKDMIIRCGENVYPSEVETCLRHCDGVLDAQVVAVPSGRLGEEVGAFLIAKDGCELHPDEVRFFCREHLAAFKVPRYIAVLDSFPMTANGKVMKYRLRELAQELWRQD